PDLEASLPDGMRITVAYDGSVFIERSIESVYRTMVEALVLVVAVIFLFLRNGRATLIPFVTIPVSLIGAFVFLYALGFTINTLTLLGLVLAIGLVVDDAIVVLENIHRHIEDGMPPFRAALQGSKEIAFAVVAMTVTLAAVFTPLAFMSGNTGRLFTEFAFTVAAAVLVSGFVALSLTPMMCSKLLRHEARHGRLFKLSERFFLAMNQGYRHALLWALRWRWLVVLLFLGSGAGAAWLFLQLKAELAPLEDRGTIIGVVVAPEGATLDYTDRHVRQLEQLYQGIPEVRSYFSIVAPGLERPNPVNSALTFVRLKPWEERQRKQQAIAKELAPKMFGGLPGVLAFPINPPSLGQSFRNPAVQFVIQASSYAELQKKVDQVLAKARQYPGMANLDTDLRLNKPQLSVVLKRDKIAAVGADVQAIGQTLETLLGGRQITRFKRDGQQYDVIVQLKEQDRERPTDLTAIFVRGRDGQLVQLANLIEVRETVAPKELNHFNRQRAAVISANVTPGYTLGEALSFMDQTVTEVLGADASTALDGQSREFRESGASLYVTFVLALLFIYLVLAAQFESFIAPLIIMLTVPLAVTGALLALFLTGGTLNVYSQIGLVMLVGLITKNGILIVEFANQLRESGLERGAAVVEAATLRLRPILMTTLATILGAIPLALAVGAGAESRQQIGWVIVGGLLLGTLLTLSVVPVAYTLLARKVHHSPEQMAERAEQARAY
ncbi:MAG TPA: efflux RND transporter permease subunit, partial [Candidatus Competibacteraceae bacterium]|nr:efflux RND transporter permease subunit [Candidatus Competibacteraceae bacterium]